MKIKQDTLRHFADGLEEVTEAINGPFALQSATLVFETDDHIITATNPTGFGEWDLDIRSATEQAS